MIKKPKYIEPDYYVIINTDGEVYTGMKSGSFNYSDNWSEAKPLDLKSTFYLMRESGNELLKL